VAKAKQSRPIYMAWRQLIDPDTNGPLMALVAIDAVGQAQLEERRYRAKLETELAECAKRLGAYKAEAEKWESIYDDCEDALVGEQLRDTFGEHESIADCARRVLRERDQLRARLAAIDAAPTVAWLCTRHDESGADATCRESARNDYARFGRAIQELIARPEAK